MPVYIAATDVQGMAVLLSKGPAIDAVLASATIPGVFPPIPIDGRLLMDGAIATNRTAHFTILAICRSRCVQLRRGLILHS